MKPHQNSQMWIQLLSDANDWNSADAILSVCFLLTHSPKEGGEGNSSCKKMEASFSYDPVNPYPAKVENMVSS
jgi:hypothetical protein